MKTIRAIRAPKRLLEPGSWHRGRMVRSAFQLSRSSSYVLGSTWDWRICQASDGRQSYRILIALEPQREQYRAWLALENRGDLALLARLEFHPSHRGWHLHAKRGSIRDVVRGVVREPRERLVTCGRGSAFTVTQGTAIEIAFRVFKVEPAAEGLFG